MSRLTRLVPAPVKRLVRTFWRSGRTTPAGAPAPTPGPPPEPPTNAEILAAVERKDVAGARTLLAKRADSPDQHYLQARLGELVASQTPWRRRRPLLQAAADHYAQSYDGSQTSAGGAGIADTAGGRTATDATTGDAGQLDRRVRHAELLERLRDWAPAAEAYRHAVALGPPDADLESKLGRMLELAGDPDAAAGHYRRVLELDPTAPPIARTMFDTTPEDFHSRFRVARFVTDHRDAIAERAAAAAPGTAELGEQPVFAFWAQGFAAAPPIVQICIERLRRIVPPSRLHLLTADRVRDYVDLPERVWPLATTDTAHFSDVLRTALLARYGGVWLDGTCFLGPGFLDRLADLGALDLFAFRVDRARISSWFLTAGGERLIARRLDAALREFWETQPTKLGYYMFHHVFEALCPTFPELAAVWQRTPSISTAIPHALQTVMREPSADHDLTALIDASFVHKLTWKSKAAQAGPDSVFAQLVRTYRVEVLPPMGTPLP